MAKPVASNRSARHNYNILETYEAGIVLRGCEVKSLRGGKANLKDGFARIEKGEVFLHNVHISPYEKSGDKKYDPERKRKLLLKKQEIARLTGRVLERGLTLVPLEIYFKREYAKVSLGVVKGKKRFDKRDAIRRREDERQMRRAVKLKNK